MYNETFSCSISSCPSLTVILCSFFVSCIVSVIIPIIVAGTNPWPSDTTVNVYHCLPAFFTSCSCRSQVASDTQHHRTSLSIVVVFTAHIYQHHRVLVRHNIHRIWLSTSFTCWLNSKPRHSSFTTYVLFFLVAHISNNTSHDGSDYTKDAQEDRFC